MIQNRFQNIPSSVRVIVVGGGVNGVGIARDLSLRGIPCLLIEKNDFSAGTSGSSSGMIHGGARYLLNEVNVTKLACQDSGYIQKIAPHLLFRIPFLYPIYSQPNHSTLPAKIMLNLTEGFFEAYDNFVPLKNGQPHTRLSAAECLALEPGLPVKNLIGGVTFDEWGIDVARLCIANVIDASDHGALVLNHTQVIDVIQEHKKVQGVKIRDLISGEETVVKCEMLVNATGPWAPKFCEILGVPLKLRGGKGIHITFDRRLSNLALVTKAIDGRQVFVMPYENETVLGTTDDDFFGDLDNQKCTDDEVAYLIDSLLPIFPQIKDARIVRTWSGVRPSLYERGPYEDDLSREHEILDHETRDDLAGVISLIGGKLASYRIMAEETVDLVAQKLKCFVPCTTHVQPLPGGQEICDVVTLAKDYNVDPFVVSRLVYRHGARAKEILELIKNNPELKKIVCLCEPVTQAELMYVLKNEFVYSVNDLRRRTKITQGPCQGCDCLLSASSTFAEYFHQNSVEHLSELQNFMQENWWNRIFSITEDQLKQEELFQALHFCNNSLDQ